MQDTDEETDDSIESYWKVARPTLFEVKSNQTSNMGEAIVRITHVLLLYANTTQRLVEADKWKTQGPKIDVRPALPKNGTSIEQLLWEVTVDFPASGLKLPITETSKDPEGGLEKAFNKVYRLLKEQVEERHKKIAALREEAEGIEEEADEIEESCKAMGVYAYRQLNLVTDKGNPF